MGIKGVFEKSTIRFLPNYLIKILYVGSVNRVLKDSRKFKDRAPSLDLSIEADRLKLFEEEMIRRKYTPLEIDGAREKKYDTQELRSVEEDCNRDNLLSPAKRFFKERILPYWVSRN